MTPSDRSEAIRRAQDGALKAANEGRWDHARTFLEYREEILKMDQSHLSAADSSAASGSSVPARPTLPGEGAHAAIMNLQPTKSTADFATWGEARAYGEGHRDARHAATELVADDALCLECQGRGCTGEGRCEALTNPPAAGELLAAAQAVVDRWDTPLWKDVPHTGEYIARLRAAIAATQEPQ